MKENVIQKQYVVSIHAQVALLSAGDAVLDVARSLGSLAEKLRKSAKLMDASKDYVNGMATCNRRLAKRLRAALRDIEVANEDMRELRVGLENEREETK